MGYDIDKKQTNTNNKEKQKKGEGSPSQTAIIPKSMEKSFKGLIDYF